MSEVPRAILNDLEDYILEARPNVAELDRLINRCGMDPAAVRRGSGTPAMVNDIVAQARTWTLYHELRQQLPVVLSLYPPMPSATTLSGAPPPSVPVIEPTPPQLVINATNAYVSQTLNHVIVQVGDEESLRRFFAGLTYVDDDTRDEVIAATMEAKRGSAEPVITSRLRKALNRVGGVAERLGEKGLEAAVKIAVDRYLGTS